MSQTVEKCVWSNVLATWGLNKEIGKIEKKTIMNWGKKKNNNGNEDTGWTAFVTKQGHR